MATSAVEGFGRCRHCEAPLIKGKGGWRLCLGNTHMTLEALYSCDNNPDGKHVLSEVR